MITFVVIMFYEILAIFFCLTNCYLGWTKIHTPHIFCLLVNWGGGGEEFLRISKGGRDVLFWWDGKVECSG